MKLGSIGLGVTSQRRGGGAQIITAIIAPSLGPLEDGDTIASGMSADYDQTSNYASSEGTISSVDAAVTVNGSPALFTDTVDFEDVVAVTVTVTDSEANERVFNAGTRTVAGIAPTNDVAPSIAGDTGLGDTLTVTAGTWSGVPTPTLAYQWLRDGAEIAGETGTTYDITLADSGALITVRETATNAEGSASAVSNAITADVFTAPVNTVAPSISGDTDLGATLTRTEGTWTGNPTPTLSGQWQRDGVAISGATGATYVIVEDDNGADITYLETATNAVGAASQASNAITVDTFTAPDAFTAPDWDVANDGETVSVNIITLPNDGGSAITDLQYRVNAGAAISLGETTTGSYPITAVEGDDIQIRAVNAVGAGDWSDVKAVPAAETGDIPDLDYDVLLEAYDPDSLFSDTAGTTAASVDGSVARVNDTSVNSNNATQATAAARPIRRQLGDLNWLDHDGVDDRLVIAPDASWNKTGMSVVMVMRATLTEASPKLTPFGSGIGGDGGATALLERIGSSDANLGVFGTRVTATGFYTNGVVFDTEGATRGDLTALWATGSWVITEASGCDLSTFRSSSFINGGGQFPGYTGTNYMAPCDIGAVSLIPTATLDTGTNRADLVAALAAKFGIAL